MLTIISDIRIALVVLVLLASSFENASAADNDSNRAKVDFKTDIRPILSNRCFACHGPDEARVESGLRLDLPDSATSPSDSGSIAIVPGDIEKSELVRRITSADESERMPPAHFGARLTEREATLIQTWIASGATFSKHWSFDSIRTPKIAPVTAIGSFPNWQHSPIDRLVLKKLEDRGWTPSNQAEPETLLRRLSLDLTGLPPSLEQQASFVSNFSELAYEQRIDELLASPAFGEHWGRKWLDLARYADSAGYADDPQRTIWAYRDWVIRSMNQGMPFDQFTIEQLAGDLLSNPTDEQLVATAFHRNTLTNNEGGTNDEEFRNVAVVDRVNTTMAVWMGVTMACAQCHSHKFDPISHKEYFQVMAIFNQTEDADRANESPILNWYTPEQRREREDSQRELAKIEMLLIAPDDSLKREQTDWETPFRKPLAWQSVKPESAKAKSKSRIVINDDSSLKVDTISDTDTYTIEIPLNGETPLEKITGLQILSLPDPSLPNGGAAIGDGNFVITNVAASLIAKKADAVKARFVRIELNGENKILSLAEVQVFADGMNVAITGKASQSSTAFDGPPELAIDGKTTGVFTDKSTTHTASSSSPWWELDLGKATAIDKVEVWSRTDSDLVTRLANAKVVVLSEDRMILWETSIDKPKANQSYEIRPSVEIPLLTANADYSQEGFAPQNVLDKDAKSGWAVGGAIDTSHQLNIAIDQDGLRKRKLANSLLGEPSIQLTLKFESQTRRAVLASFAIRLSTDERADRMIGLPTNIAKSIATDSGILSAEEQNSLHIFYVSKVAPSRQSLRKSRDALAKTVDEIKPTTTVPIQKELALNKRRATNIQLRGNYKIHGELVTAQVPTAFHAWTPETSGSEGGKPEMNRLQFARWLMQSDNPLTARVLANRYWENFFGVGIVRTSEEFGSQGDLPSNPELLDHLASDLIRSGWDTKRFIRNIVMSAAYRQRSYVSPKRYEEDPENVFVSRGPRFRVSAEQVRDMALSSAGMLSHRMFGPPTRPPQPSLGLSAAFGSKTDWEASKGEDRFRRGIYTLWRRSNPYPSMAAFDAPNREVCVLKRDRTNTPLQALVTLNDPAYVEAAQGLARRIAIYELPSGSLQQRVDLLFRLALSRHPSQNELNAIMRLFEESRIDLASNPEQSKMLATDPLGPLPAGADAVELATWTTICNVVLNLDEFLMTP